MTEEKVLHPIRFEEGGGNMDEEEVIRHIKCNVARSLDFVSIQDVKERPLIIVGGGPSLKRYWPLISTHEADVMALNNAYHFLLEHEVTPNYFMLLDGRKENVDFVQCAIHEVTHFIGVQCAPCVFDTLIEKGVPIQAYMTYHPYNVKHASQYNVPTEKNVMVGGGGTVGFKSIALGLMLGYRQFYLYGYDSSHEEGEHHAFKQKLNDQCDIIEVKIEPEGKSYFTTRAMAHQASDFCTFASTVMQEYDADIYLCCDGLLPDLVQHENKRALVPLEEREREKYNSVWQFDEYRRISP